MRGGSTLHVALICGQSLQCMVRSEDLCSSNGDAEPVKESAARLVQLYLKDEVQNRAHGKVLQATGNNRVLLLYPGPIGDILNRPFSPSRCPGPMSAFIEVPISHGENPEVISIATNVTQSADTVQYHFIHGFM